MSGAAHAEKHVEHHQPTMTAEQYRAYRKSRWNKRITAGVVLAAAAGLAVLALAPWAAIPAYIYSALGSTAIVGGGIAVGSAIGRASEEKRRY